MPTSLATAQGRPATDSTREPAAVSPQIILWVLDTRPLWPVTPSSKPKEEVQLLRTAASKELSLLSDAEQTSVLRYYHLKDAKMSLASHLLKHMVVTKYCNVPWEESTISRGINGKPCFVSKTSHIDFNVSHQAGIVSLAAAVGFNTKVDVGTDVVCWNERLKHDYAHIEKHGFFDWIDVHAEIFADSEVSHMKLGVLNIDDLIPGATILGFGNDAIARCQWRGKELNLKTSQGDVQIDSDSIIDVKLRRFYAMWCLREAYVKMTGEALLAPWLKELEITNVRIPCPNEDPGLLQEGAAIEDFEIKKNGKRVTDVNIRLSALGTGFMVAGVVKRLDGMDPSLFALTNWQQPIAELLDIISNS